MNIHLPVIARPLHRWRKNSFERENSLTLQSKWPEKSSMCIDAFSPWPVKCSNACSRQICWNRARTRWKSAICPMKSVKRCCVSSTATKFIISKATRWIFFTPLINTLSKISNFCASRPWSRHLRMTRRRRCWFERIFTIPNYWKTISFSSFVPIVERYLPQNNGNNSNGHSKFTTFTRLRGGRIDILDRDLRRPAQISRRRI